MTGDASDTALRRAVDRLEREAGRAWREVRGTSYVGDWLVAAMTVAVLATVGVAFFGVLGAGAAAATGVFVGWAAVLARYDDPFVHAAASVVCVVAAVALAALAYLTFSVAGAAAAVTATGAMGVFGIVLASAGAATSVSSDDVRFLDVAGTSWLTASGFLLAWVVVASPRADTRAALLEFSGDVAAVAAAFAVSPEPGHAVFGFFALLAAASLAAAVAFARIPLDRLSASTGDTSRRASNTSAWLYLVFVVSASAAAVSGVASTSVMEDVGEAGVPPMHTDALTENPLGELLAVVASVQVLRWVLVAVLAVSVAVAVAAALHSWVRDGFLHRFFYRKTAVAVGFISGFGAGSVAVAAGVSAELLDAVEGGEGVAGLALADVGGFALVNLSLAAALLLLVVFSLVLEAVRLALAPGGWTAPVYASTGLFLLGVAAVLVGLFVPGLVAAAVGLYVWDVGRYSAVLKRSLPRSPATSSVELVHAAGGLFVALVAVAAALFVYFVAPFLAPANPLIAAVGLLASFAVVYLLVRELESA